MTLNIIKMHFKSPLHLSRGRGDNYDKGEEVLHSDALQSALFVCARQLFGSEVGKDFFESFRVSSAFPFQGETLFLPKPAFDDIFESIDTKERKHAKGVKYLPVDDFVQVCKGKKIAFDATKTKKQGAFYTHTEVQIETTVLQRVAIPRMQETDANPFYMQRTFFGEGAGLYAVVCLPENETHKKHFKAALRLLGEQGIGTDRNVGNGHFEAEICEKPLELDLPEAGTHWLNLGLYCPEKQETLPALEESYFALVKRGGWIASPENENDMNLRKKSVYMLAEGSVLKAGKKPEGKIINLQPEGHSHEIWRDGRSIFLSINLPTENH